MVHVCVLQGSTHNALRGEDPGEGHAAQWVPRDSRGKLQRPEGMNYSKGLNWRSSELGKV